MHTLSELAMSELVAERQRGQLEQARRTRQAQSVARIRKVRRREQRAERQLLRAWRRSDELRESLESR